ncbi:MAG: 4-hydroxy-tetrahydrodipicolinate reductase [Alphaproteobacteria bacterium MarineAlpha2_Bin1]|nr:MAG: 4-hydroxy-tetrahydrodipicolinate reductase [Alphaproteobacteria bacterium MarineAlpha2_Bin1]
MSLLNIGVSGCSGKMGKTLIKLVSDHNDCNIASGLEAENNPDVGKNLGKLINSENISAVATSNRKKFFECCDIIIDFSTPDSTFENIKFAKKYAKGLVIGTTGLNKEIERDIEIAAQYVPIVYSANMSIGINILIELVKKLSGTLSKEEFDIEVFEMHHKHKVDAPSGTALALGKAAAIGRKIDLLNNFEVSRDGINSKRKVGNIGFASLRGGSVTGEHSVLFASDHEIIELKHKAENRSLFAAGAIKAAIWLSKKNSGLYSMRDVLNLEI